MIRRGYLRPHERDILERILLIEVNFLFHVSSS